MAGQAHDPAAAARAGARGGRAGRVLERHRRQVGGGDAAAGRVVVAVVGVVAVADLAVERLVAGVLERLSAARHHRRLDVVVVAPVAVAAPVADPAAVGGVVAVRLRRPAQLDALGVRRRVGEHRQPSLHRAGSVEVAEAVVAVRVVAARAAQLAGRERAAGRQAVAGVGRQPVPRGDQVVPGRVAGDDVRRAVGRVVEVVLEQEDEVAAAALGRRHQRVRAQDRTVLVRVAPEADVARGLGEEQPRPARGRRRDDESLLAVVHDVTALAAGDPVAVEGASGARWSERRVQPQHQEEQKRLASAHSR